MPVDTERDVANEVNEITTEDLISALYGEIKAVVERGKPDNMVVQYFLPGIPFGAELLAFMDIGSGRSKHKEEGLSVNGLFSSAINFSRIVDYVPVLPKAGNPNITVLDSIDEPDIVTIESLFSSGRTISKTYGAVLDNAKVIDQQPSDAVKEALRKLRGKLFTEKEQTSAPLDDDINDSTLLGDEELDLDALLGEEITEEEIIEDPDQLVTPTTLLKNYEILQNFAFQVKARELEKQSRLRSNDVRTNDLIALSNKRIAAAEKKWQIQGRKLAVERIRARISQLEREGPVEYIEKLRDLFAGYHISASVIDASSVVDVDEDDPDAPANQLSSVQDTALYTALRPPGILRAPTVMKVSLDTSKTKRHKKKSGSNTSGSFRGAFGGLFGGKASASHEREKQEKDFFGSHFKLTFELVQGIIDRPWFDLAFLESSVYTTTAVKTGDPLSLTDEIVHLSDGNRPPEGVMPLIPVSVYFVRNVKIQSRKWANASESERRETSIAASAGWGPFGRVKLNHNSSSEEEVSSEIDSNGNLEMNGIFLIGMASRYTEKMPDPNFSKFPEESDWI